jgi:hypothetical protein
MPYIQIASAGEQAYAIASRAARIPHIHRDARNRRHEPNPSSRSRACRQPIGLEGRCV